MAPRLEIRGVPGLRGFRGRGGGGMGMHVMVLSSSPTVQNNLSRSETLPNAGLMLGQRRRRWPGIKPALGEHLVFAGIVLYTFFDPAFTTVALNCTIVHTLYLANRTVLYYLKLEHRNHGSNRVLFFIEIQYFLSTLFCDL